MNNYTNTLYLDMDDVVADWMREALQYLQAIKDVNGRIPDADWMKLRSNVHFYRNLELLPGAEDLVYWAHRFAEKHSYNLRFLTAIPHDNDMPFAFSDKVLWAQERFPSIPVFFGPYSHDKKLHCVPGDILIDDRQSNCLDWLGVGGIAHRYSTWENCKTWTETVLPNLMKANNK
jgi:5'(3')-deoxyribonucleotidase